MQKRRIYDITNVLEGVGLIEKNSKNNVKWRYPRTTRHCRGNEGGQKDVGEEMARVETLKDQVHRLKRDELVVDEYTGKLQSMLRQMADDDECKR